MRPACIVSLFLSLLATAFLVAAGPRIEPCRTQEPPVIDGRLDDAAWQGCRPLEVFKTFIPDFGHDLSERTEAWIAYDSKNLYFAFKCFDRDPAKIKATFASRDTIFQDDFVCINLDSFNDQQSLYAFYVNPLGIQMDSRYASGKEDFSVDFVWESAGRLDAEGYSVEIRLPYKSIRYSGRQQVEMAIIFERFISRTSVHGSYPEMDPSKGYAFLTQMSPFLLRDISSYTLLELLPAFTYTLTYGRHESSLDRETSLPELSLTGKYGITPRLTLDATWNPDFSQVESDAGQVDANLRYDLFFPEKRPFFLEGSDIFQVAGFGPLQAVVHTRRIVDPRLGVKLSGKLGRRDTLAAIFALDELPEELQSPDGGRSAGFAILRYRRALKEDSYLGCFYTGREQGGDYNRLAGIDGQLRLSPASMLTLHGFGSVNREGAPARSGYALCLDYLYNTRQWNIALGGFDISSHFDTAAGYLTRKGVGGLQWEATRSLYPESRFWRKVDTGLIGSLYYDRHFAMAESKLGLAVTCLLPGNTRLLAEFYRADEVYLGQRFDTSSGKLQLISQLSKHLFLNVGARYGNLIRYLETPYPGRGMNIATQIILQPFEKLQYNLVLLYSDFFRASDSTKDFDYMILRSKLTYQVHRTLFFRVIAEYNSFYRRLLTDFLASFTYIPGTVVHLGYGSLYEKLAWSGTDYLEADRFLEMRRGFFFKASYNWRL